MTNKTASQQGAGSTVTTAPAARAARSAATPAAPQVDIPSSITIHDLAGLLDIDPVEIIKQLMRAGYMLTINEVVEYDIAAMIAKLYGYRASAPVEQEGGRSSQVLSHRRGKMRATWSRVRRS